VRGGRANLHYDMLFQTCFTIVSVATIRSGTVLSRKLSQSKRTPHFEERINIKEVTIFRTLAVMQLGFTLTLGNIS